MQLKGACAVTHDGQHLAHRAFGVKPTLGTGQYAFAHFSGRGFKGGAANHLKELDVMRHHRLLTLAGWALHQGAQHLGAGCRQTWGTAAAHDAGQAQGAFRGGQGNPLGNHAAHAGTHDVGFVHAQRIQHAKRICRHATQAVGRLGLETHFEFEHFPNHVGLAQRLHALAQTHIAVVVAYDPKPGVNQRLHQRGGPGNELHAQAHDEHHHRAVFTRRTGAAVFHFNGELIGANLHVQFSVFMTPVGGETPAARFLRPPRPRHIRRH